MTYITASPNAASTQSLNLPGQSEIFVIDVYETAPFFRRVIFGKDGYHRANRLACGAVNTFVRVDVVLVVFIRRVNAIHRTNEDNQYYMQPDE